MSDTRKTSPLPEWFNVDDYNFVHQYTPKDWYAAISTRRASKALYELSEKEPELFAVTTSDEFWQAFKQNTKITLSSDARQTPGYSKTIAGYIDYRILPLFDLLHWHELYGLTPPSNTALEQQVFADLPSHKRRYKAHDGKKLLRRAMLECDALTHMHTK